MRTGDISITAPAADLLCIKRCFADRTLEATISLTGQTIPDGGHDGIPNVIAIMGRTKR